MKEPAGSNTARRKHCSRYSILVPRGHTHILSVLAVTARAPHRIRSSTRSRVFLFLALTHFRARHLPHPSTPEAPSPQPGKPCQQQSNPFSPTHLELCTVSMSMLRLASASLGLTPPRGFGEAGRLRFRRMLSFPLGLPVRELLSSGMPSPVRGANGTRMHG